MRQRRRSPDEGVLERPPDRDPGEDTRASPSISCSIAGCSTRRWRAASGGAPRSTSRAARSDSGISCRTCSPSCSRGRGWCAISCCAPPRGNSSKATCSTGGTSRAARACGRDSPTIACGWCSSRCSTSAATGDAAVWDERVPFLEGRVLNPDEHEAYERPAVSSEDGIDLRALRARDHDQPADGRARPAADGHRRLERRHEPGRRRRPRRERLARMVPGLAARALRPGGRPAR